MCQLLFSPFLVECAHINYYCAILLCTGITWQFASADLRCHCNFQMAFILYDYYIYDFNCAPSLKRITFDFVQRPKRSWPFSSLMIIASVAATFWIEFRHGLVKASVGHKMTLRIHYSCTWNWLQLLLIMYFNFIFMHWFWVKLNFGFNEAAHSIRNVSNIFR